MKTYRVKVLNTGKMTVDKSILTRGAGYGQKMTVPVRSLAVEGNGLKMIVDTGLAADAGTYEKIAGVEIPQQQENWEEILEVIGWKPEEVNVVVNTHLHFDACGNNRMFPNAKIMVQKQEWEYAQCPSKNQKPFYVSSLLINGVGGGLNMELIDGECEIAEGLILLPTPGHSRGHQSLLINLEEGVLCYCGHAANLMENLQDNIIGNIVDSTGDAENSLENIRRTSEFVIPGFDMRVVQYAENGFPGVHHS